MKTCLLPLIVGLSIGAAGCATREPIPAPTAAMAADSGVALGTLERGHEVFSVHCTRCHEPLMPGEVSRADWHVVVPGMAWNAGLSESDEDAVLEYILAAR